MFAKRLRLLLNYQMRVTCSKFHSNNHIPVVNLTFPYHELKRNNVYMKNVLSPIYTVRSNSNLTPEANHELNDDNDPAEIDEPEYGHLSENGFMYEFLQKSGKHKTIVPLIKPSKKIPDDVVEKILAKDYEDYSVTELIDDFKTLSCHAYLNGIKPSEELHAKLFELIVKYVPDMMDEQLWETLSYMPLWLPIARADRPKSFDKLQNAIDDSLYQRLNDFTPDEILMSCDLIFHLRQPRYSRFIDRVILKLGSKPGRMSPANYVHFMFIINIGRRAPPNMYELEYALEPIVHLFDPNELGIIATAFFKTRTPIRNMDLLNKIITQCTVNMASMGSISLTAVLKIMRMSMMMKKDVSLIMTMLDALVSQIDRISVPTLVHAGHLAAAVCLPAMDKIDRIIEKFQPLIPTARVKDIERILYVLATYGWPTDSPIYGDILKEMRKPQRTEEYTKFFRCLTSSLLYLSYAGVYPLDMIERIMSHSYLDTVYRNDAYKIGPSYLDLETSLQVEVPQYKGQTLPPKVKNYLVKRHTAHIDRHRNPELFPQWQQRLTFEVANYVKEIMGTDRVMIEQLLPQYERPELIYCLNTNDNTVAQQFMPESLIGLIKYPPTVPPGYKWVAMLFAPYNQVFRNTTITTGFFNNKMRLLEKMGYSPIAFICPKFRELGSPEKKKNYVQTLLSQVNHNDYKRDRK